MADDDRRKGVPGCCRDGEACGVCNANPYGYPLIDSARISRLLDAVTEARAERDRLRAELRELRAGLRGGDPHDFCDDGGNR